MKVGDLVKGKMQAYGINDHYKLIAGPLVEQNELLLIIDTKQPPILVKFDGWTCYVKIVNSSGKIGWVLKFYVEKVA